MSNEEVNDVIPNRASVYINGEIRVNGMPEEDGDIVYDMLEYAEKYYNDHARDSGGGTLMKSIRKKRTSAEVRLDWTVMLISNLNF